MKEASLGFGGRQEPGTWGHGSRVKAQGGTLEELRWSAHHAHVQGPGRWVAEERRQNLSRGCRWGNGRGCSRPSLSQATQVMPYVIRKRQPCTEIGGRLHSDGQAHRSVFVFSARYG